MADLQALFRRAEVELPGVKRRRTRTQEVLDLTEAGHGFAWRPLNGSQILQIYPPTKVRTTFRDGDYLVAKNATSECRYFDPAGSLNPNQFSYVGCDCLYLSDAQAWGWIKQAYRYLKRDKVADGYNPVASKGGTLMSTPARPVKSDLHVVYDDLYQSHPRLLLPLESALPAELRCECESRDQYRIIMTMILSGATDDHTLAENLGGCLFKRYPNLESVRGIQKYQVKDTLRRCGIGLNDPDRGGNGGRYWSFLSCYFRVWKETIAPGRIDSLRKERGFGPAFVRKLQAYYLGNKDVLPLDTPAFKELRRRGMYLGIPDGEAREDIEVKLRGEPGISLIDFHEMLRFAGQSSSRYEWEIKRIVIGWNAWRLLCSNERNRITEDWKWIHKHLVKDEVVARELWEFYHKVVD